MKKRIESRFTTEMQNVPAQLVLTGECVKPGLEALDAIDGLDDVEAVATEIVAQQRTHAGVIVDHQQAGGSGWSALGHLAASQESGSSAPEFFNDFFCVAGQHQVFDFTLAA